MISGYALEPLAVAIAAALIPFALRARTVLVGGILVALGAQTFLFYLGYVLSISLTDAGSIRAAGFVGAFGAVLVLGGGIAALSAYPGRASVGRAARAFLKVSRFTKSGRAVSFGLLI